MPGAHASGPLRSSPIAWPGLFFWIGTRPIINPRFLSKRVFHVGYTILKVLHVLFAVSWLGGGLFNILVVQRALAEATPSTRREVAGRLFPVMNRFFGIGGGLTLLTGLGLLYLHPHGAWPLLNDQWGRLIAFSVVATLACLYLAGTSIRATFNAVQKAMATLAPGDPVPGNVRFLLVRLQVTSIFIAVLLAIVLALMVWANQVYFGPR